jgi:hypothetical protein
MFTVLLVVALSTTAMTAMTAMTGPLITLFLGRDARRMARVLSTSV